MKNNELIEGLNHAMNREVSTFLRYMLQAASIKGADWEAVRTLYQSEVADEVGHAQYLADKIVMLGGVPKLAPDLTPPPADVRKMLERDIAEEKIDVEGYMKLADLAERAGQPDLKMKMEEQAADEAAHAEIMTRMLGLTTSPRSPAPPRAPVARWAGPPTSGSVATRFRTCGRSGRMLRIPHHETGHHQQRIRSGRGRYQHRTEHIARIGFDTVDIFTEAMTVTGGRDSSSSKPPAGQQPADRLAAVVAAGSDRLQRTGARFPPRAEPEIRRPRRRASTRRNILLVLGEYIWQREVIPPRRAVGMGDRGRRRIGRLRRRARHRDRPGTGTVPAQPAQQRRRDAAVHRRVRPPEREANIDVSHLVLADTRPADLDQLKGKATHVHISDCDGKVHGDLPPGRGVVKFSPYLQAIKELDFDGAISIELEYSPDPSKIVEWVEEAYHATARLMELTGLRD